MNRVVYFQGNMACFDQYQHHLVNSNLFQESEIVQPQQDLKEIRYINTSTWNPLVHFYVWLFHLWRKHACGLPHVRPYWPAVWEASIGGQQDIDQMHMRAQQADPNPIFYGVSRGAMVVARYLARPGDVIPKCAILEGGPISIQDVLKDRQGHRIGSWLAHALEFCTNYRRAQDFTQPDFIPVGIPILIITSTADTVVESSHSERLFQALSGREYVYLLVLENVEHNNYAESKLFQEVVPKFIKNPTGMGKSRRISKL
jgi:pimeloyl-ACP methyl ester carboxylesterase